MNNVHLVCNLDLAAVSHSPPALPAAAISVNTLTAKQDLNLTHSQYLLISTCYAVMCASTCMGPFWSYLSQGEIKKANPLTCDE